MNSQEKKIKLSTLTIFRIPGANRVSKDELRHVRKSARQEADPA